MTLKIPTRSLFLAIVALIFLGTVALLVVTFGRTSGRCRRERCVDAIVPVVVVNRGGDAVRVPERGTACFCADPAP